MGCPRVAQRGSVPVGHGSPTAPSEVESLTGDADGGGDAREDRAAGHTIFALALVIVGAAPAVAAPGDIHRVAHAETVNLRPGPSNESNVRGTVQQGDEVIWLRRSDSSLGARVLRTGEEGWIFSALLEPVSRSTLGTGAPTPAEDVGVLSWSEGFNRLFASIDADNGYPMAKRWSSPKRTSCA